MASKLQRHFFFMCCTTFIVVDAAATTAVPSSESDKTMSPYSALRRRLRSRDDVKEKLPPGGGTVPVQVGVLFQVANILDVDDARQVVAFTAGINLNWTNSALAWNDTSRFPRGYAVEIPVDEMWVPSAYIGNSASNNRQLDLGKSGYVNSDGAVFVVNNFLIETTCQMDLRKYPFDQQECKVSVLLYSSVPVDCRSGQSEFFDTGTTKMLFGAGAEWTLLNIRINRYPVPEWYGTYLLDYFMVIKRKTTFFVVSFITPIVMTSYMNTLVFLLPAESGERISYIVSIFVSNAVFLSFCTNFMPQGLDSIPLVMYLLLGIMAESGVLVIINSVILHRHHAVTCLQAQNHAAISTGSTDASRGRKAGLGTKSEDSKIASRQKECGRMNLCLFLGSVVINTVLVVSLLTAMMN